MSSSELHRVFKRPDLAAELLLCDARAVIVFGSRAAGCARPDSDWDFLCVGRGTTRLRRALDVVWISPERTRDPGFLHSELANHVAVWGKLIHGQAPWLADVSPSSRAAERKRRVVHGHARGTLQVWDLLGAHHRARELRGLRRELQRYEWLVRAEAVPPTAVLDAQWSAEPDPASRWRELAELAGVMSPTLNAALCSVGGTRAALCGCS